MQDGNFRSPSKSPTEPPSPSSAAARELALTSPTTYAELQARAHPPVIEATSIPTQIPKLRAPTIHELAYAEKAGIVLVLGVAVVWLAGRVFHVGPSRAGGEVIGALGGVK